MWENGDSQYKGVKYILVLLHSVNFSKNVDRIELNLKLLYLSHPKHHISFFCVNNSKNYRFLSLFYLYLERE